MSRHHLAGRRSAGRRAVRLIRAYPPAWRARYGDEFVELLIADLEERPRSWRRTADVVASGLLARSKAAGLTGYLSDPAERARGGLAVLFAAAATFFAFGVAMWSQVAIGWRWEPPSAVPVAASMILMSLAAVLAVSLAIVAAAPLLWSWARQVRRGRPGLMAPTLSTVAGGLVLVGGSRHFQDRWPGTGGHVWAYHAMVPAGATAFAWSATRGITSFWVHPGALASFSGGELAWMAISLPIIVVVIAGITTTLSRLELSLAVYRFEAQLARTGGALMLLFLAGASCWVLADEPPGPTGIYRVGLIDTLGLLIMALALALALRAVNRVRAGALELAG